MEFEAYFQAMNGKRAAVLGLGVSNRPLVRLLLDHGIAVIACDKTPREKADEEILEFERRGAELRLGESYLQNLSADVVFRTPSLRPDHPALLALREQGAEITSEMEAFFSVCPCKILAVTGSDGKTTTTTLISKILEASGKTVWVGGNIGAPLLDKTPQIRPDDLAVLELSSFQLMSMTCSPAVSVVTNLAPNHLDIHKNMAEYIAAKENIYLHQTSDGVLVVNMDNNITDAFSEKARGAVLKFSRSGEPARGVFLKDGVIYRRGETTQAVLRQSDILLPGIHNVENYMAAICAVEGLATDDAIRSVAKNFGGVEHRIELVRVLDGVSYYNDSIASSPSRTIAGLNSFDKKLILIAGGYDKHIPYDVLGPELTAHVKTLILTGATAEKIRAAALGAADYRPGAPEIAEVEDMKQAVLKAKACALPGDVVILSPASASFDRYKNFMERGDAFKKIVMEL